MLWLWLTLVNVLGNGTGIFLLKRETKKSTASYITVMLVMLCFSEFTIFWFAFFHFLQHPILFTNVQGIFYFLISALFNTLGFYCFIKALSLNELSIFGPLETLRPFFVVLFSLFLFHVAPSPALLIGISFIVMGTVILQFQKRLSLFLRKLFASAAPLFIIASAVCFALTSILDKHAIAFIDPLKYSFLITLSVCLGFIFLHMLSAKKIQIYHFLNPSMFFAGLSFGIGQIGIYTALTLASPNVIVPVQMTRSLYLSFLGFVLLREKDYTRKIIAAALMLIGVIFITI